MHTNHRRVPSEQKARQDLENGEHSLLKHGKLDRKRHALCLASNRKYILVTKEKKAKKALKEISKFFKSNDTFLDCSIGGNKVPSHKKVSMYIKKQKTNPERLLEILNNDDD